MADIPTSAHLDSLRNLARPFADLVESIDAVPDIQTWCIDHGVEETNPFRTGKCLRNNDTGKHRILLADPITQDMKKGVLSLMALRHFDVTPLQDDVTFLKHLLFHELAHATDSSRSEQDCDAWALQQLAAAQSNQPLHPTPPAAEAPASVAGERRR